MRLSVQRALVMAGVGLAAWLLARLTPAPAALVDTLRHPQEATLGGGIDTVALAAATVACWVALTWLTAALVASASAVLPGPGGRLADRFAAATVPTGARRLLAVTLGVAVVTSTGVAPALAGPPQPRPAASTLDLDWPAAGQPAGVASPPIPGAPPATARPASGQRRSEVLVRPGDNLWTIAGRQLPPGATDAQIAAAWPRWYLANRSVVGSDPDLLLPGQRLIPPTNSSGGQP